MSGWRVGIDCRLAGLAHAGIGRYTAELVNQLFHLGLQDNVHWILFCRDAAQATEITNGVSGQAHFSIVFAPIQQYSLAEQVRLPQIFSQEKLDLLHVPHFNVPLLYRGKTVITIHDLLWHEQRGTRVTTLPVLLYWLKYLGYKWVTAHAINNSERVFVPTQFVATSVTTWYPHSRAKVRVTVEGASTTLTAAPVKRAKKVLLYVGSLYPHKNLTVVLQALEQLPDWQLQVVGARSVFLEKTRQEVSKRGIQQQVAFLGKVSDQELAQSYKSATAVIQPSLSEGFGLTGLEALALGTPLIASDIPVFHEVYQDAAAYFDPRSAESLRARLETFDAKNPAFSAETQQAVLKQYSWKKMAADTYHEYLSVLNAQQ